jgi:hypothetical protein
MKTNTANTTVTETPKLNTTAKPVTTKTTEKSLKSTKPRASKRTLEELYATNLNKLSPDELKVLVKDLSKRVNAAENAFESFKNSAESAFKEANYYRELYTKTAGRRAGALDFIKQQVAALHKTIELTERELNRDGN